MHSPKFEAKSKILAATVNSVSLGHAWKNKVRVSLRRQIVPDPLEFLDFHVRSSAACDEIANEIKSGTYAPRRVTRMRSEKSNGLCRLISLPSVEDALVLQVLADSLWKIISEKAPTDKSFYAPQDNKFKAMRKGLEDDYGPIGQWLKFQKEILGFSRRRNYVIVTDIANYYDWIRYDILRNVIADKVDLKEIVLDLLLFELQSMIWRPDYMPQIDIGLPQADLDAPRMLAHTFLFEADELLKEIPDIDFARFADDIDIGVDTYAKAKCVLRDLDLTLQSRHLRLNSGKTRILTAAQAGEHFCVAENAILDRFESRMTSPHTTKVRVLLPSRILPILLARWNNDGTFTKGNGQKILKRLVNYSRVYQIKLDEDIFLYSFINWPGMRDTLLRYVSHRINPIDYMEKVCDSIDTGYVVDDVTWLRIATAFTSALYTRRIPTATLARFIDSFDKNEPYQLFSLLWILSRFGHITEMRKLIDSKSLIWTKEPILIRAVAGFASLFRGTNYYPAFVARTTRVGGKVAQDVLEFCDEYIYLAIGFKKISKFVKAPNPSIATGITHAKFLMLLGFLSCTGASKAEKAKFLLNQVRVRRDLYYRYLLDARLKAIP